MSLDRFAQHITDFDLYLKRAKEDFEIRYAAVDFAPHGKLEDFKIVRTLGSGAFGRVVLVKEKAKDQKIRRETKVYAIKMIEKDHIIKTKQLDHLTWELRISASVNFSFVIRMDYFFKNNIYIFMVLPFLIGGNMYSQLRIKKMFDEGLARFYASQVVLAFEYLHYLGIVYRDLKPENILIDLEGYIKVADLGFAKKIERHRTYTLCGTPEYIAPEIILSQGYNAAVDWWSFGILIYEMSAGCTPFVAKTAIKIYEKACDGKYTCPAHFSNTLKDLVSRLLQVERVKRIGLLKNGIKDIKSHDWFKVTDWDDVLNRKVKAPFKPRVMGPCDTRNFSIIEEEEEPMKEGSQELYQQEFSTFEINAVNKDNNE